MTRNAFNRFLRAEAAELQNDGGQGGAPAPAAQTETAPGKKEGETGKTGETQAAAPREPNLIEKAFAVAQSKGSLLAKANEAALRAEKAEGDLATVRAELTQVKTELATLKTERAEIEKALNASQAEATTVEQKAADIVASTGVPAVTLPSTAGGGTETEDELMAQMQAETDPQKRFKINQKINALNNG